MFLPLGDEPNPRGVPVVTYALILANCAVYVVMTLPLSTVRANTSDPAFAEYVRTLLQSLPDHVSVRDVVGQISAYDLVVFTYGYRPSNPHLYSLFTAMFLHAGFMHLFGNMLFLWIYGDNVEQRLGRVPYLLGYLGTGVAATLFHGVFADGSPLPLVGASGAISGVLGFYFIWFPHNIVRVWVLLFPFFMNVIRMPARLVLGFYLLADNLLPFLLARGSEGGVAHGAHIGGFLVGLAVAWGLDRQGMTRPATEFQADTPSRPVERSAATQIAEAIDAGQFEVAAQAYFALPSEATRRLVGPAPLLALGHWLAGHGHHRAALVAYQRYLRDYPLGPGVADAHIGAGLVQLHGLGQTTAAYQHLVEALDHDPSPETLAVVRQAMAEIAARQKFQVGR